MLLFEKDSIISASIVSSLSECLAFVIADDLETRKNIADRFKKIYRKRSLISHGKLASLDIKDLEWTFDISRRLIISFLTREPFKNFSSMAEFKDYITELKFR